MLTVTRSRSIFTSYFDEAEILSVLLRDSRCDVALGNARGLTAIHTAAVANAASALSVLLSDHRARLLIDAPNEWGETALHLCAAAGNVRALNLLLDVGASHEVRDR